jgi:DNA-binding HxlR family transcriptional regulator
MADASSRLAGDLVDVALVSRGHPTAVGHACEVKKLDFTARRNEGQDGVVRTYGQYCPIARGAEIFAERWTPLIIRNLHLGCGSFSEILEGAPGLSRTLLSERLKHLERLGIVRSVPKSGGRGRIYRLTPAGEDLYGVCDALGRWGAQWLEIAPEHLDPFVALWSMCNALRRDRLPERRIVTRFDFTACRPRERYWLLIERKEPEICRRSPGLDEDLFITAEAEAFVRWHAGLLAWSDATRDRRIQLHGPTWLVRAFPTWNARSAFADVTPHSRPAGSITDHGARLARP